jgi:hypothetical protein
MVLNSCLSFPGDLSSNMEVRAFGWWICLWRKKQNSLRTNWHPLKHVYMYIVFYFWIRSRLWSIYILHPNDILWHAVPNINILMLVNKGNNKITELRTILQRESKNS